MDYTQPHRISSGGNAFRYLLHYWLACVTYCYTHYSVGEVVLMIVPSPSQL
jgi:hypothetical protein